MHHIQPNQGEYGTGRHLSGVNGQGDGPTNWKTRHPAVESGRKTTSFGKACLASRNYAKGKLKTAICAAMQAVEEDPAQTLAWQTWARALLQMERYSEALKVIRQAERKNPGQEPQIAYWSIRIRAYLGLGELGRAEHYANQGLEMLEIVRDGRYRAQYMAEFYDHLGKIYAQKSHYEEAIRFFAQALRADPTHDKAYKRIGITYFKRAKWILGDFPVHEDTPVHRQAGEYFETAIEFLEEYERRRTDQEDVKELYLYRGKSFFSIGCYGLALCDFNRFLERYPGDPEVGGLRETCEYRITTAAKTARPDSEEAA